MRQLGYDCFFLSSRCKGNLWDLSLDPQQGKCLFLMLKKFGLGMRRKRKKATLPVLVSLSQPKWRGFSWRHLEQGARRCSDAEALAGPTVVSLSVSPG